MAGTPEAMARMTLTTFRGGTPFAERDLIVFTTVVVIVLTVLLQGLTLPLVIRWAGLTGGDDERDNEIRRARIKASEEALGALPDIAARLDSPADMVRRVRADYEDHLEQVRAEADDDGEAAEYEELEHRLRLAVLQHERQVVTRMRDTNTIDDIVLRDLQESMDIEEMRLVGRTDTE